MNSSSEDSPLWRLFALERDQLSALEQTLLRTALLAGLVVFAWTFLDVCTHPGDDLRNRVVGARVMLAGYDPYTFVWNPPLPQELLDPIYDPHAHRLTISPPTLLLYAVVAPLPFKLERFISFAVEWLALILSLILLTRSLPELRQRVVFLLGALLCVIATDVWRLHLERGQIYVLYLLALSIAIACSQRGQIDSIAAGIALGALGLMRPNLLVIAPALCLMRQWRSASAMLTTISVGAAAAFFMLPFSSWQSYLGVGEQYYRSIQDPDAAPLFARPAHEGPVEGVVFGTSSLSNVETSSFAVLWQTLDGRLHLHERFGLPPLDVALASKAILAALAGLLLALLWWRRGSAQAGFALAVVLGLDTEFFLPHRWGYADVMLLAPLALLLPELLRPERTTLQMLGVVLLGLLSGPCGQQFFGLYTATVLRSWLVMGGLTALVLARIFSVREIPCQT